MDTFEIGKKIKFYREKIGKKKYQLAVDSGISPTYINDLENGRKSPTVDTLYNICWYGLGISLKEFFSEDEKVISLENLTDDQKNLLDNFLKSL